MFECLPREDPEEEAESSIPTGQAMEGPVPQLAHRSHRKLRAQILFPTPNLTLQVLNVSQASFSIQILRKHLQVTIKTESRVITSNIPTSLVNSKGRQTTHTDAEGVIGQERHVRDPSLLFTWDPSFEA